VRPVRPVFTGAGGAVDFDSLRGVFFMSDLKQAAQELLDSWDMPFNFHPSAHRFEKLRAALAQPIISPEIKGNKAEPVAGMYDYTAPPQRKPLTDEALVDIWADSQVLDVNHKINTPQHAFARAIEKAHGIGP
jgi:hypothetical protein